MRDPEQIRREYRACIKLADLTDSKREDGILRRDAAKLLDELKQACRHAHVVILRHEYAGSYSYDYDDAHGADHVCLCCGAMECDIRGGKFETLTTPPFASLRSNLPAPELLAPLKYSLLECIEAATARHPG